MESRKSPEESSGLTVCAGENLQLKSQQANRLEKPIALVLKQQLVRKVSRLSVMTNLRADTKLQPVCCRLQLSVYHLNARQE